MTRKKPLFFVGGGVSGVRGVFGGGRGVALGQVQQFETGTRHEVEILHQCGKRVKY